MGFKKGWIAYKKAKGQSKARVSFFRKANNKQKFLSSAKKPRGKKMPIKKHKRKSKKVAKKSGMEKVLSSVVDIALPVAYGFARDKLSDGVNKVLDNTGIGQKLPVTEFTDEAIMLGVSWGVGKLGVNKSPMGRKTLKIVNIIEKGRIGQTMSDIQQEKKEGTSPTASNW